MKRKTRVFLRKHLKDIAGKTVFLTGGTGEIGQWITEELLYAGASVVLGVRNPDKARALRASLLGKYPEASLSFFELDLNSVASVDACILFLRRTLPEYCIINSGYDTAEPKYNAYGIEERMMVNCYAPYRLIREIGKDIRCVAVASVSYRLTAKRKDPADLYAYSKALFMQLLYLLRTAEGCSVVLAHPGIAFTGLFQSRHSRMRWAFSLLRRMLKSKEAAALNIVYALSCRPSAQEWVGPRGFFEIFGPPGIRKIRKGFYSEENLRRAIRVSEEIERKTEELK